MKPTNLNKETCNPISSNCVVWQGPDIPCIKLCKGDTVSDVVAKLATELCTVLDIIDVTNYDLTCFNITACGPQNFQQLIQFIIDQICELQNLPSDNTTKSSCPDCLVTVNQDCFSELGQVAQLIDYVIAIATKVCGLVLQIATIQSAIVDLDDRVTVLESYFPLPTPVEPNVTPDCVLPSVPTPVSTVLTALEAEYCQLVGATGSATDIINAYLAQCIANNDPRFDGGGDMDTIPGWFSVVTNIAESITNLWLTVCDLRSGISTVSITPTDTQTIDITVTGGPAFNVQASIVDTGWVDLNGFAYYTGSMSSQRPQCRRIGNIIHFRGNVVVPLSSDGGPTLIPLASSGTYNTQWFKAPYTGSGGVFLNPLGSITFNYDGVSTSSVIPSSVWNPPAPPTVFDNTYSTGVIISTRQLQTVLGSNGTSLSAAIGVFIDTNGQLVVQTLKDLEQNLGLVNYQASSPLRFITSNVRSGDYLPDYAAAGTDIQNAPSNANFNLVSDTYNVTYPFSLDGALETDLGGFGFRIDGLMAYIAP